MLVQALDFPQHPEPEEFQRRQRRGQAPSAPVLPFMGDNLENGNYNGPELYERKMPDSPMERLNDAGKIGVGLIDQWGRQQIDERTQHI
jgi:hypothetical protein